MTERKILGAIVLLAVGWALGRGLSPDAHAQAGRTSKCVLLVGGTGRGDKGLEQGHDILSASPGNLTPLAERWVDERLAEGRTALFGVPVQTGIVAGAGVQGTMLCAY